MTDLNTIILTFSEEEKQKFTTYLEKKNKRKDTKNIQLFKLIHANKWTSSSICKKIYSNKNKAAYHALRKRLYQSIIDFIANNTLEEENSTEMKIIKYILASRTFLLNKKYKVAYKLLDKAEAIAQENYLFPILNEVYHTKIQYAYANPDVDLNTLVTQYKTNQKNHYLEDQLNIVYAKIRQAITNANYNGAILNFETLLTKTLSEHNISINDSMSFKSLYQLMTIVSISAFATNDYLKTEPFLIQTYSNLLQHKSKDKELYYHIQVLYLIANTLFRNKKFKASISYLELMHDKMILNKKKHYNTFYLKYNLLLALNLNYSNQQAKAIALLEPILQKKSEDLETLLDSYLSLITFYMQASEYKKASNLMSNFYHTDRYYESKAGKEWIIKKNLIEIILHIELENLDLVDSRLLSFKRSYYDYLKTIKQQRVITYLTFIEAYSKNPNAVTTTQFKAKVEASFEWIDAKKEDIFVMSFYAWLKSKMDKNALYTTTLELVEKAQRVN